LYTNATRCRICGGAELSSVLDLGNQALTGVFPASRSAAVPAGPVELVKCTIAGGCGLVQLRQSYDVSEMYGANYGYRSGLNASMVRHLESKVARILGMDILREGDVVIDIGSNDATTLKAYPQGRYELIGVDPTGKKFATHYPASIRLIPDFFSAALLRSGGIRKPAKVITSFSMFYDLESPMDFMRDIAQVLDAEGIWVCEQSYLPTMLDTVSFDTICHEHLEFYGLKQIQWMAGRTGLKIIDVEFNDVNGGSFSIVLAREGSSLKPNAARIEEVLADERDRGLDGVEPFEAFCREMEKARDALMTFLHQAKASGHRVMGLGASTKGNVLLQRFGIDPTLVACIGEVNPDKFGCFTPGSLIPIVSQEQVLEARPDYLLVLPWHFRRFFEQQPSLTGRTLVFPLPRLEIVKLPPA
jgi:NDP-4-keto-2,6-dideoxyhexose 3-C-methyltransferase